MGYRGELAKQDRARALRAQGWTLAEIAEEVGCSRSSASLWCRDVVINEAALAARRRQRARRGNEGARRRAPNKLQRRKQAEIEAAHEWGRQVIGTLDDRDLLLAAVALYAARDRRPTAA